VPQWRNNNLVPQWSNNNLVPQWEAIQVSYATASITLRILWPHNPHVYVKVGTSSGGFK
jgi:hypothetical protein